VKDLFNTGRIWDNSITLSTALGTNGSFAATVTRTDHEGIFPNSSYEKTAVSVGGYNQFESGFRLGANLAYTKSFNKVNKPVHHNPWKRHPIMARSLYLGRSWDIRDNLMKIR
jgi:hypothetical protein